MCEDYYDKPEIEQVTDSIAGMMDGDCWAGPSPYTAEVLDDRRSVVITSRETGNRFRVIVMSIAPGIEVKKKTSGLYSPEVGSGSRTC
jgi:hypothetical protein